MQIESWKLITTGRDHFDTEQPAEQRLERRLDLKNDIGAAHGGLRGVTGELDGVAKTLLGMKQKPLAGNVLARPFGLREAAFDPARQLAAPFIGWPSPRKIAGEQQQECAVGLRLCVVWSDHDGAVVARKGLIEASQLLQDAGAVDHRLDQIRT